VAESETLFYVTLSIWSWSLLQFTLVFTKKTKKKKKKKKEMDKKCCGHKSMKVCCSVDVWSILINIILQDAPFFTFRLLLIFYYKVISYMNIFFTCKNTLVIILQFYRLIVVQAEKRKGLRNPQLSKGIPAFHSIHHDYIMVYHGLFPLLFEPKNSPARVTNWQDMFGCMLTDDDWIFGLVWIAQHPVPFTLDNSAIKNEDIGRESDK